MMANTESMVSKPEVRCQNRKYGAQTGSYSDQLLRRQCAIIGALVKGNLHNRQNCNFAPFLAHRFSTSNKSQISKREYILNTSL